MEWETNNQNQNQKPLPWQRQILTEEFLKISRFQKLLLCSVNIARKVQKVYNADGISYLTTRGSVAISNFIVHLCILNCRDTWGFSLQRKSTWLSSHTYEGN